MRASRLFSTHVQFHWTFLTRVVIQSNPHGGIILRTGRSRSNNSSLKGGTIFGGSSMDEQAQVAQKIKGDLIAFLEIFNEYAGEIRREGSRRDRLDELRTQLQRKAPQITNYILDILGNSTVSVGSSGDRVTLHNRDLLATALLGGNNELPHNFRDYNTPVTSMLNRASGTIEAGLWPLKGTKPILIIKDSELRDRCSDLLSAPGNYDRVIREATTVLENRIRSKCPHDVLTRLIPHSVDQTGENLVNKLLGPDNPVLSISNDNLKRKALHRMMLGIISYLRNPYHHRLDPSIEWSWAWSTAGLIDRLLVDIENCVVTE